MLADAYRLDEEEVAAITRFVEEGGSLYASGASVSHFAGLFGVTVQGQTEEQFTYIAPLAGEEAWLPEVTAGAPLTVPGPQVLVTAEDPATVKAHVALPFTKPKERAFASIHSNPPGKTTRHPALIYREVGRGRALWVSAPIEREERQVHAGVFRHLIDTLHPGPFRYSAEAPAQVEVVVWDQPQEQRFVVHLVNLQERLPVLPIHHLRVTLAMDGRQVRDARLAPGRRAAALHPEGQDDQATVECPPEILLRNIQAVSHRAAARNRPITPLGAFWSEVGTPGMRLSAGQPASELQLFAQSAQLTAQVLAGHGSTGIRRRRTVKPAGGAAG